MKDRCTQSLPWTAALSLALCLGWGSRSAADVYVVQVGDGAAPLSSASTAVTVLRFDNTGGGLGSIALPTVGAGANLPFTVSGTATSEGFLQASPGGQYLTLAGYAVSPGVASVAGTTSAAAPRSVARITVGPGAVDTTTAFTGDSSYTGSNIRSAVTTNGSDLWVAGNATGSNGGVRYTTLGGTTSTILTNVMGDSLANARSVGIFDGQLYVSTNSSAAGNDLRGVNTVGTGLPTTGMQPVTNLFPTGVNRSSNDFWFRDANTLYVADDGSAANGGGIQKWTNSGGVWTLAYTMLNNGATTTGVRGLTGAVISGTTVLYATTTQTSANRLISVLDTDPAAPATTLATALPNTVFRGVEFVGITAAPEDDADFDDDGDVDGQDFLTWQRGLGVGSNNATGDANNSGTVDAADLGIWRSQFAAAVPAVGVVPEPAGLGLAIVAIAACGVKRRRGRAKSAR